MPTLTINGTQQNFEPDKRLVSAVEEMGVHIGHRCGGNAKCTTCRVEFSEGEPEGYTRAEYKKLKERDLLGQYRLSCQHTVSQDMTVTPIMTLESEEGWTDTGPDVDPAVQPEAEWFPLADLQAEE
jgi:ferredoxin